MILFIITPAENRPQLPHSWKVPVSTQSCNFLLASTIKMHNNCHMFVVYQPKLWRNAPSLIFVALYLREMTKCTITPGNSATMVDLCLSSGMPVLRETANVFSVAGSLYFRISKCQAEQSTVLKHWDYRAGQSLSLSSAFMPTRSCWIGLWTPREA